MIRSREDARDDLCGSSVVSAIGKAEWKRPEPRLLSDTEGVALFVELESRRAWGVGADSMLGRGMPVESKLRPVLGRTDIAGMERGGLENSEKVGEAGPRELRPE